MAGSETGLGAIVHAALDTPGLGALEAMLRAVANHCDGFGAALWQVRIDAEAEEKGGPQEDSRSATLDDLASLPADRTKLFVAAHGFDDENLVCAYHDLRLDKVTGKAVIQGEFDSRNCEEDQFVERGSDFYRSAKPKSLFSVRIVFEDQGLGAITLYSREEGGFREESKQKLRDIARFYLPSLYSAILVRVSYRLIERISFLLDTADDANPKQAMQPIVKEIGEALACKEVSIFFDDRVEHAGRYDCEATTFEKLLYQKSFVSTQRGFTAMAVKEKQPVTILDLRYPPARLHVRAGYAAGDNVHANVAELLKEEGLNERLPIGFVAIPLIIDGQAIGVLRCQLRIQAPYYFSEAEVDLLRIVAARVGSFWNRHIRHKERENTAKSWEVFVDTLNTLEGHQRDLFSRSKTAEVTKTLQREIYIKGLQALHSAVSGADILDVALIDAQRSFMTPVVILPDGGSALSALPIGKADHNSWAYVYRNHKQAPNFFIEDTRHPEIPYLPLYPDARQAMFTPIVADDECVGILSMRSRSSFADIDKTKRMASLVALQFALYHQLTTILLQQANTYQDLAHQLRTPVFQARKRARRLLERSLTPIPELPAINGLLSKTQRVLGNMRLYEDLAHERPVSVSKSSNTMDSLLKLLSEACADHRVLWRSRNLSFILDRDSFVKTRVQDLRFDSSLLEQVVSNLLDNAGKYSRSNTDVNIYAEMDDNARIVIFVTSVAGIRIEPEDLPRLGVRGFRSQPAINRTAEGSGIGLYLVKQVMSAHGGALKVEKTDEFGLNRLAIIFPV